MQKLIQSCKQLFQIQSGHLSPEKAYDLWASSYDDQPNNLMLHLDAQLVEALLLHHSLTNKHVVDIGCGTGRHWNLFYSHQPASLTGFDVSKGMLEKLQQKFPAAKTVLLQEEYPTLSSKPEADILLSTLTTAHIANIKIWMEQWTGMLKPGGLFFITDFHPALLANGGKRTFAYKQRTKIVKNYVHSLESITEAAALCGLVLQQKTERFIDDTVKHWYVQQNALTVYKKHFGEPVIYGLLFKKNGIL